MPTGPRPIKATFNTSFGAIVVPPTGLFNARVESGYGFPHSKGSNFGCCKSWRAAKYPVGRISARRRRELSARVAMWDPVTRSGLMSSKRKRVPPA